MTPLRIVLCNWGSTAKAKAIVGIEELMGGSIHWSKEVHFSLTIYHSN
jgi:hypothetical protein